MITFTPDDILKLKIYCQTITYKPMSLDRQKCVVQGGFVWCTDWEIIEILKYLFHGRETYLGDPPPRRLKDNPLWSQEDIAFKGDALLGMCKDVDEIIDVLITRRGEYAAA